MTITLDTPLLGPVDTTPALLIPAFSGHAYDDATVAAFAAALVKWAGVFGVRASILTAQIAKETGYFTFGGQVQPSQFNMAGLGATNGGAAGASYPDIDTGVCAVCVHWMAYLYGDVAQWPAGVRQYQHLDDRYSAVLSTGHAGQISTLATVTNGVWAYSKQYPIGSLDNGYATGIVTLANTFTTGGTSRMPRIIVSAGHEHIASITSDPNGVIDPAALRGGTGANGEVQWTVACADALTALLHAAGADVVRTDAIYHADVYGPDADLVVVLHYDGGAGTGRAQYCMAATVHSGPSTVEADSRADAFVADWYTVYCAQMGIAGDGPITVDMTQEYEGWYRSANTPMAILEHCLGADAAGIRADRPTPEASAAADFAALATHFNLNAPPVTPPQFQIDGFEVGEGIAQLVGAIGDDGSNPRLRLLGKCLGAEHDEYLVTAAPAPLNMRADLVVAVRFERGVLLWDKGRTPPPFDVRCPMTNEQVLPADDVLVQAVLENMRLAGVA